MAPMAHDGALMMPDGADSRTDGAGALPGGGPLDPACLPRLVCVEPYENQLGQFSKRACISGWANRCVGSSKRIICALTVLTCAYQSHCLQRSS